MTQLRVVHVDANEVIHIKDGKFLLRVSVDTATSLVRCMIRHTSSGREAYIQGGLNLPAFVKDCLLAETRTPISSMEFQPSIGEDWMKHDEQEHPGQ